MFAYSGMAGRSNAENISYKKRTQQETETSTPEHLFAAGYADCFGSACDYVARQQRLRPTSIEVEAAVGIGQTPEGAFGLTVALEARIGGLSQAEAEQLVAAGHEVCPYSQAVAGNVDVQIKAVAV